MMYFVIPVLSVNQLESNILEHSEIVMLDH